MSLEKHAMNKPLNAADTFEVLLLTMAEITKNILVDRNPCHEKRKYWLEKLDKDIEGLNRTYEGFLPDQFQDKAERFYRMIETDVNWLLANYDENAKPKKNSKK